MKKEQSIYNLKSALLKFNPIHDTPIGLVHPYWARKPLNIIELIITTLTKPNDFVLDPFMGSGTTIFGSIRTGRKSIGSDLNPLSVFVVEELLRLGINPDDSITTLKKFISKAEKKIMPLFLEGENRYIERERYNVNGNFEYGAFKLDLIETVTKEYKNNKWSKRKVTSKPINKYVPESYKKYINKPFDFANSKLIYNSRIAIPEGANLSHFFTELNLISLNLMIEISESLEFNEKQKKLCKFLISASLPLLRLSDKKASNQWPYWRPKNNLTSRNPISIIHDRFQKIRNAIKWLSLNQKLSINELGSNDYSSDLLIGQCAVQDLLFKIGRIKPKLILTDPPYNDHVPYIEYSAFWNNILGFTISEKHLSMEIVNSDAPSRKKDTSDYTSRLEQALYTCSKIIDSDGLIVWFYQDQILENWSRLYLAAKKYKLHIIDILPIKKQRRSMKTVTSPNKTLDGDLIIIFSKNKIGTPKDNILKNLTSKEQSYFEVYADFIKKLMLDGSIIDKAKEFKKVNQAILTKTNNYVLAIK